MPIHHCQHQRNSRNSYWAVLCGLLVVSCGGGGDGPAIQAQPQTITFTAAPTLSLGGTATVSATASSGLPIVYHSDTPFICSVVETSGVVSVLTAGECIIGADQYGNDTYAPARQTQTITVYVSPDQTITFGPAPALGLYSTATVSATADSGLPVTYSSLTPTICTVDAASGLVNDLAAGACTIAADQAGNTYFHAAPQAAQTLTVTTTQTQSKAPGVPTAVVASLGSDANTVTITVGATDSGGAQITGYMVVSSPQGITASSAASTLTVTCPGTCNGYAFAIAAVNAVGTGEYSAPVDVVTAYKVVETFREPATQPNDSIFTGRFNFNSTKGTVSDLQGSLTESMTGGCATLAGCPGSYGSVPMTLVPLKYQLKSEAVTIGGVAGLLVTTFALETTNTFYMGFGSDGWSPQSGVDVGGVYYGFPSAHNPFNGGVGNAYAMIFISTSNPLAPLAQAQIDKLAYADCAAGGMMGAVCMTGTAAAGYGLVDTMGGYPVSQIITRQ